MGLCSSCLVGKESVLTRLPVYYVACQQTRKRIVLFYISCDLETTLSFGLVVACYDLSRRILGT